MGQQHPMPLQFYLDLCDRERAWLLKCRARETDPEQLRIIEEQYRENEQKRQLHIAIFNQ